MCMSLILTRITRTLANMTRQAYRSQYTVPSVYHWYKATIMIQKESTICFILSSRFSSSLLHENGFPHESAFFSGEAEVGDEPAAAAGASWEQQPPPAWWWW